MRWRNAAAMAGCWVLTLGCAWGEDAPPAAESKADLGSRLVLRLGDPAFERREAAGKELLQIGLPARDAVRKALQDADPEVRGRAEKLWATGRFWTDDEKEARVEHFLKEEAVPFLDQPSPKTEAAIGEVAVLGRIAGSRLFDYLSLSDGECNRRYPKHGWKAVSLAFERILQEDAAYRGELLSRVLAKGPPYQQKGQSMPGAAYLVIRSASGAADEAVLLDHWRRLGGRKALEGDDIQLMEGLRIPATLPVLIEALALDSPVGDLAAGALATLTGRMDGFVRIDTPTSSFSPFHIERSAVTRADPKATVASWRDWWSRNSGRLRWDPARGRFTTP